VNVPAADEAVLAWMALQDNHSLSMRMLIRESIERHGYIDVMNRPVDQLPKRGRPATAEEEAADAARATRATQPQPPAPPVLHLLPPASVPASAVASVDLDLTEEQSSGPELLGIALESPALVQTPAPQPVAPVASAPVPPEPEQSSSGHMEVNDIFSTLR
jgi:hypothetical protein